MGSGSGTIRVVKRDGCLEKFSRRKLAGAMHRAILGTEGTYDDAWELAWAIEIYLRRRQWTCISSAAVFDMAVKVLRRVCLAGAADAMLRDRADRAGRRGHVWIDHGTGRTSLWDKTWIVRLAEQVWQVSDVTARILAGDVEHVILQGYRGTVPRQIVVDLLARHACAYGLAGAVAIPAEHAAPPPLRAAEARHSPTP